MEIKITAENFRDEVLQSDITVLVDFYAEWCGPCRMIAPFLAELAEEYEGTVKIGKINVNTDPSLAVQYGVDSIPTLILFRNGEAVKRTVGYQTKAMLAAMLSE